MEIKELVKKHVAISREIRYKNVRELTDEQIQSQVEQFVAECHKLFPGMKIVAATTDRDEPVVVIYTPSVAHMVEKATVNVKRCKSDTTMSCWHDLIDQEYDPILYGSGSENAPYFDTTYQEWGFGDNEFEAWGSWLEVQPTRR